MKKKIIIIALFLAFFFIPLLFINSIGAEKEFSSEKRAAEYHIQTTFGLELFHDSEKSDGLSVERISYNISWGSPLDNNTLDLFFNVSSVSTGRVNLTLIYHFNYRYGDRAASFYPETFNFAEIENDIIKNLDGSDVSVNEETISIGLNITYNRSRTFTITGELDLEPPEIVNIKQIEVEKEGIVTIDFDMVDDAWGYYLYLTEKKCVNVENEAPFNSVSFDFPPILLTHLEVGEEIYVSISAYDLAGNINHQVDCVRFVMKMPNRPPVAKIDAFEDNYEAGERVYFTCRETGDPDTDDKLIYSWDLDGDGKEDSADENPNFRYRTSGNYRVTLTVTDRAGLEDTTSMVINILDEKSSDDTDTSDENKQNYIVLAIVSSGLVAIILLAMIVKKKRQSGVRGREKKTGKKNVIKFLEKEKNDIGSIKEYEQHWEDDETETTPVEQIFRKIGVMEGFGGDQGIATEKEMIKFLPMKTSTIPRKHKKKRGRGRRKKTRIPSGKSHLIAAVPVEEMVEAEKSKVFYSCPRCDEVLEVAISVKSGPLDEIYTVSCPVCSTKGDIVI